jgi:hypothetical protein
MVNKLINYVQREFDDFILLNAKSLKNYSSNSIRDFLLGRNQTADPTVLDYIEKFYSSSIENNSNLSIGTKKNYVKANRHLKKFLIERKKQNLLVKEVNSSFAIEFKDYLLCSNSDGEKSGMTEPSALGNIKKFRTIF